MAERETSPGERPMGFGVDGARAVRPGVPRERNAPDPGAWWGRPERQRGVGVLSRKGLRGTVAVFGTAQPPRGASGAIRRVAYRIPERRAARWALLLAGDRLDVLEHRVARSLWLVPSAVALVAGYVAASRALRR